MSVTVITNSYDVFGNEGSSVSTTTGAGTYNIDDTITLSTDQVSKTGLKFSGWSVNNIDYGSEDQYSIVLGKDILSDGSNVYATARYMDSDKAVVVISSTVEAATSQLEGQGLYTDGEEVTIKCPLYSSDMKRQFLSWMLNGESISVDTQHTITVKAGTKYFFTARYTDYSVLEVDNSKLEDCSNTQPQITRFTTKVYKYNLSNIPTKQISGNTCYFVPKSVEMNILVAKPQTDPVVYETISHIVADFNSRAGRGYWSKTDENGLLYYSPDSRGFMDGYIQSDSGTYTD